MHTAFIIFIYLVVKTFQLLNGFVLAHLFGIEEGFIILRDILLFVGVMLIFNLLIEKFLPPLALGLLWAITILVLFILLPMNPFLMIVFLIGMFLYALVYMETQVFRSLSVYRNIPHFALFALSIIPVVASYTIPQARVTAPQLFYVISSIFVLIASYSTNFYKKSIFTSYKKSSFFLSGLVGLIAIAFSGLIYYLSFYSNRDSSIMSIAIVLFFYISGALYIYASINQYLQQTNKK